MEQKNIILFDWFSFTSRIDSPESIINILGLTDDKIIWQKVNGAAKGYLDRIYFFGISIHFNGRNGGVFVEMSGQGCRAFEEFALTEWTVIFNILIEQQQDYHITRIDIAYDDFEGKINISKLYHETDKCNFVTKFRRAFIEKEVISKAMTCYYGSKASNIFFRCYDKAKERNREDIPHWIRWEIQFRDERAFEFLNTFYLSGSIGRVFFGVVNRYIRFIKPDSDETNISRLKTARWWSAWLDSLEQISLYTSKDTEYNLYQCENYVYNQAGNAVEALIHIKGLDKFYEELLKNKPRESLKYQELKNNNVASSCSNDILDYLAERGVK